MVADKYPRNDIADDEQVSVEAWKLPEFAARMEESATKPPSLDELESIREQARKEGFQAGLQEGRREGRLAMQKSDMDRQRHWLELMKGLNAPYQLLDERLEKEVIDLVVSFARQLVHHELVTQADDITMIVRHALKALPSANENIRVHLNPQDAAMVRDVMKDSMQEEAWTVVDDSQLKRGDCVVNTENSQVDATLESRMNSLIAKLLGMSPDELHDPDFRP